MHALSLLTAALCLGTPTFSVTDLGQPSGSLAFPYGMNNGGVVTGQLQTPTGDVRGWRYENGNFVILPTIGGLYNTTFDVNDAGQATGFSTAADGSTHGVVWEGNSITDVGNLGFQYTTAYRIGPAGQVIGHSSVDGNQYHGYVWKNGTMTDFGTLGGDYIEPRAINTAGVIVGWSYLSGIGGHREAFVYDGANPIASLGTLGGDSVAAGINNSNVIVGMAQNGLGGPFIAFQMTLGSVMQPLGAPYYSSRASDINDSGWITGWAKDVGDTNQRGFLYANGQFSDLNSLIDPASGWYIIEGSQINNQGQIAARGMLNGQERAILLTLDSAVPEPGSAALLALAAGVAGVLRAARSGNTESAPD